MIRVLKAILILATIGFCSPAANGQVIYETKREVIFKKQYRGELKVIRNVAYGDTSFTLQFRNLRYPNIYEYEVASFDRGQLRSLVETLSSIRDKEITGDAYSKITEEVSIQKVKAPMETLISIHTNLGYVIITPGQISKLYDALKNELRIR